MDRNAILREVEQVLPTVAPIYQEYAAAKLEQRFPNVRADFQKIAGKLIAALQAQPEFSINRGIIDFGGAGVPFNPEFFIYNMLKFAVDRGPSNAVAWVEKVLACKEAEARCVYLIGGLKPEKSIVFAKGKIELMPFDDLPESEHKQAERAKGYVFASGPTPQEFPAKAAIVQRVTVTPFFTKNFDKGILRPTILRLEEIINALAIATGHTALPIVAWAEYVDADLEAAMSGRSYYGGLHEIRPRFYRDEPINPETVKSFIDQYLNLKQPVRDLVNIANSRINQALRRRMAGDKTLDAAIGIEALLGVQEDRGEITDRLARRTALVIGGCLERRKQNREIIRDFYALRSALVHTGRAPSIKKKLPETVAEQGIATAIEAVKAIVSLGEMPPWDEWELIGRSQEH
ncbi:MAG TPA: hypothetical protein VHC39_06560 [Rhizomicrobium sp.]|nr:hypothetical protein [Rhizomicrobium sp.]